MLYLAVLACLGAGVGLVAIAERYPDRTDGMRRTVGMLVVVSLIGLGFAFADWQ